MDINLNIEIKNDCCNTKSDSKKKSDKSEHSKFKSPCKREKPSREHTPENCDDREQNYKSGMALETVGISDPINISTIKSDGYVIRTPQDSIIQNKNGIDNLSSTYELTRTAAINTTTNSATQLNNPVSQGVLGAFINPVQSNSQVNLTIKEEAQPVPFFCGINKSNKCIRNK